MSYIAKRVFYYNRFGIYKPAKIFRELEKRIQIFLAIIRIGSVFSNQNIQLWVFFLGKV